MLKNIFTFAVVMVLFSGCMPEIAVPSFKSDKEVFMFLVDGSGSMTEKDNSGVVKMAGARTAIRDIVSQIDTSKTNMGLIYFNQGCGRVKLGAKPDNNDPDRIIDGMNRIKPNYNTPLGNSMRISGDILRDVDKPINLIILSDGKDTCDGNPILEAKKLWERFNGRLKIYVIGYSVDSQTRLQLEQVAKNGHGQYFDAKDQFALDKTMNSIVSGLSIRSKNWSDSGDTYTFKINFDPNSDFVKQQYYQQVKNLANYLKKNNYHIEVQGHSDSKGSDEANQKLSQKRADAVSGKISSFGIASTRIKSVGYGETTPIASNDTEDGRFQNRRVEAHINKLVSGKPGVVTPISTPPLQLSSADKKNFVKQYGSTGDDKGNSVAIDNSGNVYITGFTSNDLDGNKNSGRLDIFLTKFSTDGKKIWTKQYGTRDTDKGNSVAIDSSGNIYITGYTTGNLDGNRNRRKGEKDIFLTKFSTDGKKIWTKQYGTGFYDEGNSIAIDSSGNIFITGSTFGSLDGRRNRDGRDPDVFLTKFNSNGTKFWTKQYGKNFSHDFGNSVTIDNSGAIYVAGHYLGNILLIKYSSNGKIIWEKNYGSKSSSSHEGSYDSAECVKIDSSGNIYITGSTQGDLDGNRNKKNGKRDIFLTKFSTDGKKIWTKQYGTKRQDSGNSIAIDSSGNIFIAGATQTSLDNNKRLGKADIFLTKFSTDGKKTWTKQYGTKFNEEGNSVTIDNSGAIFMTGYTGGGLNGNKNRGNTDIFLKKFNASSVKN